MDANDLETLRKELDLPRAEFARKLGIGHKSYYRYINGDHSIPPYVALGCAAIKAGLQPYKGEIK